MNCKLNQELSLNVEKKLNRIQGQVNGIAKMVLDNRCCEDILIQISAVKRALDGVAKDIMFDHMGHCVKDGISNNNFDDTMRQLTDTVSQYIKSR